MRTSPSGCLGVAYLLPLRVERRKGPAEESRVELKDVHVVNQELGHVVAVHVSRSLQVCVPSSADESELEASV